MNVEENRLQTFNTWPTDAAITSARAAKAGFFYTNRDLIVECFACHIQIGEWNYGDQVMAKHKLLSPQCPFVLDPSTSGNVPNISQPVGLPTTTPTNSSYSLKDENVRLQTFANWPKPDVVTPESLARAGFYSLKESDFTKCAFCDVVLVAWEPGDDPDKEHQRCSPSCYFVQWVINTRLGENTGKTAALSNLELVSGDNLEELGVQQHKTPKNPKYATYESRHLTFTKWPTELTQKPDELATAGFYFEGAGDKVRCFHCDGGLNHWEPHDDPWSQHARWFPYCAFVQLVKGKEFIKTCATSNFEDHACRKREASAQRKEISETEIVAQLTSEPALAALNIGLHVGRVKQAIKEKLEQTGVGFSTSDALIEATLNIQAEEEDDGDARLSENVSSMLRTVLHDALCEEDRAKNSVDIVDRKIAAEATCRSNLTLEEENRLLKEARLCKICMDSEVGIVFLPCGHLATCVKCAPNLKDCPVCRSSIKATVRTFLS